MNPSIMRVSVILLFIVLCFTSCDSKKAKSNKKHSSDSSQKDILKEPLDTSMISLRSFKLIAVEDLLSQDWNLEDVDKTHWNDFFWDSAENKRKYPGLSLFRDQSFTENIRTGVRVGKWNLDKANRRLSLTYPAGEKRNYYIDQLSLNGITLVWTRNDDSVVMKFSSDNIIHKQIVEDPFYYANNRWRIKPPSSESPTQIRARVKDCVHFFALFFKDNRYRSSTDISFIGLPCCFEWYNGGISLQKAIELDKKWINCFYSEDQAYRGYDMLKTFFETKTLKWPSRKIGWVGQTQIVLEQIRDSL